MNKEIKIPECQVVTENQQEVVLQLSITANAMYFQGHFPNAPVLPGVVLLDWAVQFAQRYFPFFSAPVMEVQALKFQKVVHPNSQVILNLNKSGGNKVVFKYHSREGQYGTGRLLF
ncbi:thioester dehydrase [Pseudoalteromonas luteoviolacea]|uniref:ApeI family dehydratase n=1 Tax=Pseudoalteromonas luteoviolacea TaxID=43657 RepID=UPI001F461EF8|nr:thioester dehydrase [Pseudoalteromonas luteoviolacea]MCF6442202.1 thioester dehydrase [Pseudoalteromonas luteoviolacea]